MSSFIKTDYYGQIVLIVISILSTVFLYYFGPMLGLFILGCWQLISAAVTTSSFCKNGLKQKVNRYWVYTGVILLLIFLCWPLSQVFDPDDVQVVFWIAFTMSIPLAFYYISILNKLIQNIELAEKNEDLMNNFLKETGNENA